MPGKRTLLIVGRSPNQFRRTLPVRIKIQAALIIALIEEFIGVFLPTEPVERTSRTKVPQLLARSFHRLPARSFR